MLCHVFGSALVGEKITRFSINPLFQANPPTTGSSPSQSHQFVIGFGEVRLLIAVVVSRPAVGHQEVKDGRVVCDLRTSPAHHQSAAVHMLHLHVDGSTTAYWEEERRREEMEGMGGGLGGEKKNLGKEGKQ